MTKNRRNITGLIKAFILLSVIQAAKSKEGKISSMKIRDMLVSYFKIRSPFLHNRHLEYLVNAGFVIPVECGYSIPPGHEVRYIPRILSDPTMGKIFSPQKINEEIVSAFPANDNYTALARCYIHGDLELMQWWKQLEQEKLMKDIRLNEISKELKFRYLKDFHWLFYLRTIWSMNHDLFKRNLIPKDSVDAVKKDFDKCYTELRGKISKTKLPKNEDRTCQVLFSIIDN